MRRRIHHGWSKLKRIRKALRRSSGFYWTTDSLQIPVWLPVGVRMPSGCFSDSCWIHFEFWLPSGSQHAFFTASDGRLASSGFPNSLWIPFVIDSCWSSRRNCGERLCPTTPTVCPRTELQSFHSTFTHLRGGLVAEFRKLLIPLHLDLPL